jgi:hypothetical protein
MFDRWNGKLPPAELIALDLMEDKITAIIAVRHCVSPPDVFRRRPKQFENRDFPSTAPREGGVSIITKSFITGTSRKTTLSIRVTNLYVAGSQEEMCTSPPLAMPTGKQTHQPLPAVQL